MELHHPIMSKLWDRGGQTKRKKRNNILVLLMYFIVDFSILPHDIKGLHKDSLKICEIL